MTLDRRQALAALTILMIAPAGRAQDAWTSKPVRVILPYTGGGAPTHWRAPSPSS